MASSGSFNTSNYEGRYLTFAWQILSQSVANNTTTISWTLKGAGVGQAGYYDTQNIKVKINGNTVYDFPISEGDVQLWNGTTVKTGTYTITHNDDGTGSFTAYAEAGIYVWAVNCTGSGTFTLDTIARASQPSLVTWPDSTQNVGDFGETFSIHMNRKSDSFTHTVRYEYGNRTGTIATKVTTGTTWAVPLDFMNDIPSALSGSGRIYVDTYNGSTLVGTKYTGFTATVPASVKPTCTMTLEDITGVDDIYGSPVKGLSKIEVTVSATKAYSSAIKSYSIQINGTTYYAATATSGVLKNSGSVPVTVTVKDARGRSGSASYNMNVQDYTAPAVTKLTADRCNQDGTANKRGGYVKVTFSAIVSSMNSKNTAAYRVHYKKTSDSTYSTVAISALANNYAPSNQTYIFAADSSKSYDVVIEAIDRHNISNPAFRSIKAPTASAIFSWRGFKTNSGKEEGAGIGKIPEKANTLQIGWVTEFDKDVALAPGQAFYGAHGIVDYLREYNATPEEYMVNVVKGVVWEFKTLKSIGFTAPSETYGALQTIVPWQDSSGGFPRQVVYEGGIRWTRIATSLTSWGAWVSDSLRSYPVGSIYWAYNHTSPAELFGGTWTRISNSFLWASDANGAIGQTGGERTHTLTVNEMPSHNHNVYGGFTVTANSRGGADYEKNGWIPMLGGNTYQTAQALTNAGSGAAHNNMPPYIQVSAWRRTA